MVKIRAVSVVLAAVVIGSLGTPALASSHLKPKPGRYSATIKGDGGYPSFTVTKKLKVTSFIGTAPTATGCTLTGGYAVPPGAVKLSKKHHFSNASTSYGGIPVRVTINGTFITSTEIRGHLIVHYKQKKYAKCNASLTYVAARVT